MTIKYGRMPVHWVGSDGIVLQGAIKKCPCCRNGLKPIVRSSDRPGLQRACSLNFPYAAQGRPDRKATFPVSSLVVVRSPRTTNAQVAHRFGSAVSRRHDEETCRRPNRVRRQIPSRRCVSNPTTFHYQKLDRREGICRLARGGNLRVKTSFFQ